METKYINIYIKDGKIVDRPTPRKRMPKKVIDLNLLFWQFATVFAIVLLLVAVHIGVNNISLTQELSTELSETKVELAKVQEAYNHLTGTYWTEDHGFSVIDPLPGIEHYETLSIKSVSYRSGFDASKVIKTTEETVSAVTESVNSEVITEPAAPAYPEVYNQIPLDPALIEYIYTSAVEAGIKPEMLFAIGWKETDFTIDLISSTDDYGLFQINKCNFKELANAFGVSKDDMATLLLDPYFNTDCSIYMLQGIIKNYHPEDWHQVLMTYNMGPGNAANCFAAGKYSSEYSRKVVNYAMETYGLVSASL